MGHALGFSHSPDIDSVMFAYDTPRKWKFTSMDKYNMRSYYGAKASKKENEEEERKTENEDKRRKTEKDRGRTREHESDDIRPNECRVENPIVVQYRGEYLIFKVKNYRVQMQSSVIIPSGRILYAVSARQKFFSCNL